MHQYSGISLRILQVMLRAQGFWWQLKRRADFQIPSKPGCSQKLLLECLSNCMHPCILFISVFFFFSNQNGSFCKNIMEMDHSSFFFFNWSESRRVQICIIMEVLQNCTRAKKKDDLPPQRLCTEMLISTALFRYQSSHIA